MRPDNARQPHPAARQLLEDHRERGVVDSAPPYSSGTFSPNSPKRPHRLDQRVRIFVAMLHLGRDRDDVSIDEFADRPRDQPLVVVQLKHRVSLGWQAAEERSLNVTQNVERRIPEADPLVATTSNDSCCAIVRAPHVAT